MLDLSRTFRIPWVLRLFAILRSRLEHLALDQLHRTLGECFEDRLAGALAALVVRQVHDLSCELRLDAGESRVARAWASCAAEISARSRVSSSRAVEVATSANVMRDFQFANYLI